MTEKQYRLNKWGTRLLKNNRPLFDWMNDSDEIVDLLNQLNDENEQLKKQLECSREEADDYCEELMGKDEFVRLYERQRDDALKENEELKRKVKHFKELWAETSMENAELREKIDKSNKRFVKKLNTIQKQWG